MSAAKKKATDANGESRRHWWRDLAGVRQRLSVPVAADSVAVFRCAFGWIMVWHMIQYVLNGRAYEQLYGTFFRFRYPGFEWVPMLGKTGTLTVCWVMLGLAVLIGLGVRYRLASGLFGLGYAFIKLYDASNYNNHDYLICLIGWLLAVIPASSVLTLGASKAPRTMPTWGLWLLRFQIAVPYFFGGIAKLGYDWMVLNQPMFKWFDRGLVHGIGQAVSNPKLVAFLVSWGGIAFDLAIVPLLLWRRTRLLAYFACVAFHLTNANMFRIGPFPWLMIVATAIFLDPAWPQRWRLTRRDRSTTATATARATELSTFSVALLAAWLLFHTLVPLRHLVYPGNANWNELGHEFAWRMKLRDKVATTTFYFAEGNAGASSRWTKLDELDAALTSRQLHRLSHKPEMVRQFARFLDQKLDPTRTRQLKIRVEQSVSLNDRSPQLIIDPEVDLLTIDKDTPAAAWLLPLKQ